MRHQSVVAPTPGTLADTGTLALLVFSVGGQKYGLPVTSVVRIVEMVTITPLPYDSTRIQGIINLQGKVVPVMDLRQRFGLPKQDYGLNTPIILTDLGDDGWILGLIVDVVEDVINFPREKLEITQTFVPPQLMNQMAAQVAHLAGVAKTDYHIVHVLEARALLSFTEKTELSQSLTNGVSLAASSR